MVRALEAAFLHAGKSLEGSTIAIQVVNENIIIVYIVCIINYIHSIEIESFL